MQVSEGAYLHVRQDGTEPIRAEIMHRSDHLGDKHRIRGSKKNPWIETELVQLQCQVLSANTILPTYSISSAPHTLGQTYFGQTKREPPISTSYVSSQHKQIEHRVLLSEPLSDP